MAPTARAPARGGMPQIVCTRQHPWVDDRRFDHSRAIRLAESLQQEPLPVRTFLTGLNAASPRAAPAARPCRACGPAAVPGMGPGGRSGRGRAEGGTWKQRPGQIPGRCSQLRLSSPSTALMTDGAGGRTTAVSPSQHLPAYSRLQTRGAGFRIGIAAGHLPAISLLGQCADPRGRLPRASDPPLCPPLCRGTAR